MTEPRSATLFCTEGASDKTYQLDLKPAGDGWVVNFAFGRRGSALKPGTKTNSPVGYAAAVKIYDKLLSEKLAKGYTSQEDGMRYAGTEFAGRDSGLLPQLPTAIAPADLGWLLDATDWGAQEKFDGENRMVALADDIQGINRKGLIVPVPAHWTDARPADASRGRTVVCGEDMGDYLAAFDIVELDGANLRPLLYPERHKILSEFAAVAMPWATVAPYAASPAAKRALLAKIEAEEGEGLVFKQLSAGFTEGRTMVSLKHKLKESSTFIVTAVNAQRSVRLGLLNVLGDMEDLGNVTVPANKPIPAAGDLVEVEYMYRYEGGALMQPIFKGARNDIDRGACTVAQVVRIKSKLPNAA